MNDNLTISNDHVVEFNYTLTDGDNNVIDTSEGRGPLPYIHGHQNIVPGLEKELTGKTIGDKLKVVVSPEEGYGVRHDQMIQTVPKSQFGATEGLEVGAQFQVQDQSGQMLIVTVIAIEGDNVTLDGNHPLAGQELHFDVEIMSIRTATEQELSHGHVHAHGESCGG
jgi:FKBP-type peptidyl-prolyl cis-trans isomerase SlyD